MGCLCAGGNKRENDLNIKKVYSWDVKKKHLNFDSKNFAIDSLINEERVELPGYVDGQQFLIQNCKESSMYILDHMNTLTVDDCVNCKIITGPVKGSVYIRDCKNCIFVVACGQLRIRDSRKILAFAHSETQPVIEASSAISFGSYQLKYNNIEEHFRKANLDETKKNWRIVHDFTPLQSESNWKFAENDSVSDFIKEPVSNDALEKLQKCEQTWTRRTTILDVNATTESFTMDKTSL